MQGSALKKINALCEVFCVASELCYFLLVLMYFRRGLRSVNIESYNYSLKCVANSRQALDGGLTRLEFPPVIILTDQLLIKSH